MSQQNDTSLVLKQPRFRFGPPFSGCANHTIYENYEKLIIMISMGSLTVIGLILNILIYLGFITQPKLRRLPCAKMIWHLMVPSDIFTCLCLPFIIVWDTCGYYLDVPQPICIAFQMTVFVGSNASKWSVAFIAIERFFAINWPLKHRKHFTSRVENSIIGLTWIIITVLVFIEIVGWPLMIGFFEDMPRAVCDSPIFRNVLASTLHQIFGWYALFILTVLSYIGLGYAVIRAVKKMQKMTTDSGDNQKRISDVYKTFQITSLVVLSFAMCWMPYQIVEFLNLLNVRLVVGRFNFRSVLLFLTYLNSVVNPVTYFFMDGKYRKAIMDLLLCRGLRNKSTSEISFGHPQSSIKTGLSKEK